jgi:hypothetical protein
MNQQNQSPGAPKLRVEASVSLLPNLAELMHPAPALMDALASEFAPTAARLSTQKAYWLALNGWITDRLSGPMMDGKVGTENVGEHAWAVYTSSYWGGMELRENWGMPSVIQKMGVKMAPPFAEVQQAVARNLTQREDSTSGIVYPIAYNAGVQVVKTEDSPVGQRRPQRPPKPSAVRINGRDFMRVDYDLPTPHYLKVWRSAFERAVTANPPAYEGAILGEAGQTNLRDIWKRAVVYGNTTWGGDANDKWSEAYFNARGDGKRPIYRRDLRMARGPARYRRQAAHGFWRHLAPRPGALVHH